MPVGGSASGTIRKGHLMAVGFQMNTMLVNRMLALEQAHIVEHKVCDSKMSLAPWICTGTLRLEARYSNCCNSRSETPLTKSEKKTWRHILSFS